MSHLKHVLLPRQMSLYCTRYTIKPFSNHCGTAFSTTHHSPATHLFQTRSLSIVPVKKAPNSNGPVKKASKMRILKQYGLAFLIVESCTYAIAAAAIYMLLSNGVEMSEILAATETYVNVDYWVDKLNVDKSILTGTGSKVVISLVGAELTTPARLPLDLSILYYLKYKGYISKPKS